MLGSAAASHFFPATGQGSTGVKTMKTLQKIAVGAAIMLGATLATAAPAAAQNFGFSFGGPGYGFSYNSGGYYGRPYGYGYYGYHGYYYGSPYYYSRPYYGGYYGRPYYGRPYYGRPYRYRR
jgi:hypothetical protein